MPYKAKKVISEAERRGATLMAGKKHKKLEMDGTSRPFTISHGARELDDHILRQICKWGGWDFDDFKSAL